MPKPNPKRQKQESDKVLCVKGHKFIEESTTCQKCDQEIDKYIACLDLWRSKTFKEIIDDDELYKLWLNNKEQLLDEKDPNCINLCMNCASKCSACGSWMCNNKYCIKSCVKCHQTLCGSCVKCCKHCRECHCPNCKTGTTDKNYTLCELCGERENCEVTCNRKPICGIDTCIECEKKVCFGCYDLCPDRCGAVCKNCKHFCWGC